MGRRRALLTDSERELLTADDLDDENRRYQAVSRGRNKIEDELPRDIAILEENHAQLLAELREVACDDAKEGDDVEEMKQRLLAANKAIENDDPDELCRHVRAACEVIDDG